MGTIEPTLVALVFAVTGASAFALRLVPLLCGVVAAVQVYWLGRRMTSRRVALWAGCFCALGSPFFVLWTLRAKGGYIEFIVLGQWLLLLALRPARAGWREAAELGLFGLVVGLALWTNPLSFIYVVAALVALWLRHPVTARIRPAAVGAAVAGCLVGIGPVWWPTLAPLRAEVAEVLQRSALRAGGHSLALGDMLAQQAIRPIATMLISLPILFGGWTVDGLRGSNTSSQAFWRGVGHAPALYALALLLAVLVVFGIGGGAIRVLRALWRPTRPVAPARRTAAALAVVAVLGTAAFMEHYGGLYATPRYFLPVMTAAPLAAAWWARVAPRLARRLGTRLAVSRATSTRCARASLLACALGVLLWNAAGLITIQPTDTTAIEAHIPVPTSTRDAVTVLTSHALRCAYVDGYWLTYTLAFESQERVIPIAVTGDRRDPFNRYPPYLRDPACAARIGYVELAGTAPDAARESARRAGAYPGYVRIVSGQFAVYVPAR
jgi:4-amino-4-deoxy-L-arabinose transferase-like glycosyltransferase